MARKGEGGGVTCTLAGHPPGNFAIELHVLLGVEVEDGAVVAHLRQNLGNLLTVVPKHQLAISVRILALHAHHDDLNPRYRNVKVQL